MEKVRVRFAPSPTGSLHIGGLRTALYNYLFARKHGGTFIVRIEDTDRERFVEGATESLLRTLAECGLAPDEGVQLGSGGQVVEVGESGPYVQSARLEIYERYAEQLLESGHAYRCFCAAAELEQMRVAQQAAKQPPRYDRRCLRLSKAEVAAKLADGAPRTLRLKVPDGGLSLVKDEIRGEVTFSNSEIDDQVLVKSDGFPTYHLANVVDDHLMGITHVIRGDEWLPSTPKHLMLYGALGWEPPRYAHLPLILAPTRKKLSKRQGDVAVEDFLRRGYLPEPLVNFVALLGWNPGDEREVFALPELVEAFSLERIGSAGAIMDTQRLEWFNAAYVRRVVAEGGSRYQTLLAHALPLLEAKNVEHGSPLGQAGLEATFRLFSERLGKLSDLVDSRTEYLFTAPSYESTLLVFRKSDRSRTTRGLEAAARAFRQAKMAWEPLGIAAVLERARASSDLAPGDIYWPVRAALTGQEQSPPPQDIAAVIGHDEAIKRLEHALALLVK